MGKGRCGGGTCFARGSLSAWSAYKKASPERGGAREAGGGFRFPAPQGRGGSVSRRDHNPEPLESVQLTGGTRTSENVPTQAPTALRERGAGGEALLSGGKRPLPQNLHNIVFLGGTFLQKGTLPLANTYSNGYFTPHDWRRASIQCIMRRISAWGISGHSMAPDDRARRQAETSYSKPVSCSALL